MVIDDDLFPEKVSDSRSGPAMDSPQPPALPLSTRLQAQVDLFPEKVPQESPIELFPEKIPQESTIELFPEKVHSVELFPDKVGGARGESITGKSLAERIRDAEEDPSSRELFPELARRNERRRRRKAEDHF
jgi:hypothetical protein